MKIVYENTHTVTANAFDFEMADDSSLSFIINVDLAANQNTESDELQLGAKIVTASAASAALAYDEALSSDPYYSVSSGSVNIGRDTNVVKSGKGIIMPAGDYKLVLYAYLYDDRDYLYKVWLESEVISITAEHVDYFAEPLTFRLEKGSELTFPEGDGNTRTLAGRIEQLRVLLGQSYTSLETDADTTEIVLCAAECSRIALHLAWSENGSPYGADMVVLADGENAELAAITDSMDGAEGPTLAVAASVVYREGGLVLILNTENVNILKYKIISAM